MNEVRLIEKLRLIEALYAGATTTGEKLAAEAARDRILERLRSVEREAPPIEYRFTMGDMWARKVFVALLRRYGLRPYRYKGQRYTTVMARVSTRFVEETLWPEFEELSETLQAYLSEVTDRVVGQVIHQDSSDAAVVESPALLGGDQRPASGSEDAVKATSGGTSSTAAGGGTGGGTERSGKRRRKRKRRKRR
jgi:hypothetical protein